MNWRRLLARTVLTAACALLALGPADPAQAHAALIGSAPADGAVVAESPRAVRLWFSEDIAPGLSTTRLLDTDGRVIEGIAAVPGDDPRMLTLDLPALPAGAYALTWRVVAEDDGHPTGGTLVFSVRGTSRAATAAAADATGTAPLDAARRWLWLCLLAGLIGGLAVAGAVLRRAIPADGTDPLAQTVRRADRRVLAVAAICGGLAVVVGAADLAIRSAAGPGPALLLTRWGRFSLLGEGLLCALTAVTFTLVGTAGEPRRRKTRTLWTAAGALAAAAVSVEALRGHAAGLDSYRGLAAVAAAAHILTACVWLGAIAALAAMRWRSGDRTERAALFRACRPPFTRMVLLSAGLIAATGLYHAGQQVASAGDLVSTGYGRVLLAKAVLVTAALVLGLCSSARWRRSAAGHRGAPSASSRLGPGRLLVAEVAVGLLVLLGAAVLGQTAPGRVPEAVPAAPTTGTGTVDDLVVTVALTPNRPGVNGVTVLAASAHRPPPAPIDAVAVEVASGATTRTLRLRPVAPGRYIGAAELRTPGPARLTAVISRGPDRLAVPVDWSVPVGGVREPARGPRLRSIVEPLAVLILAAVIMAALWWSVLSRWRWRLDLDAPDESR